MPRDGVGCGVCALKVRALGRSAHIAGAMLRCYANGTLAGMSVALRSGLTSAPASGQVWQARSSASRLRPDAAAAMHASISVNSLHCMKETRLFRSRATFSCAAAKKRVGLGHQTVEGCSQRGQAELLTFSGVGDRRVASGASATVRFKPSTMPNGP